MTASGAISFELGGLIPASDYRRLRSDVGWGGLAISDDELEAALQCTWNVLARRGEEIVGFGRLLDDGALYASVWDMIVIPESQRLGIGGEILTRLLARADSRSITVLVATAAGRGLYERHGFFEGDPGSVPLIRRRS